MSVTSTKGFASQFDLSINQSKLGPTIIIGLLARLLFTLFAFDSVTAFTGVEPFSIATVDSSASHWRERLYWERAAELAHSNNSFDASSAFTPYYLDQIPYWPVKFFMLLEDAAGIFTSGQESGMPVPRQSDIGRDLWSLATTRLGLITIADIAMIILDGAVVTLLLRAVAIKVSKGKQPAGIVAAESPSSLFLHALNPLAMFCCCTLSLRVVEHVVVLALIWLLLVDEPVKYQGGCPVYVNGADAPTRFKRKFITVPASIMTLCLLIAMSPGMVVLLVPIGFHFYCNDGQTSYRKYAVFSLVTFIISGFVAYMASIGLAEIPTTTPPDAGHQSYLWQILLPEIAELAQATFVIGPVAACTIIGLQLCDPLIRSKGYKCSTAAEADAPEAIEAKPVLTNAKDIAAKRVVKAPTQPDIKLDEPAEKVVEPALATIAEAKPREKQSGNKLDISLSSPRQAKASHASPLLASVSLGFNRVTDLLFGQKAPDSDGDDELSLKPSSAKKPKNTKKVAKVATAVTDLVKKAEAVKLPNSSDEKKPKVAKMENLQNQTVAGETPKRTDMKQSELSEIKRVTPPFPRPNQSEGVPEAAEPKAKTKPKLATAAHSEGKQESIGKSPQSPQNVSAKPLVEFKAKSVLDLEVPTKGLSTKEPFSKVANAVSPKVEVRKMPTNQRLATEASNKSGAEESAKANENKLDISLSSPKQAKASHASPLLASVSLGFNRVTDLLFGQKAPDSDGDDELSLKPSSAKKPKNTKKVAKADPNISNEKKPKVAMADGQPTRSVTNEDQSTANESSKSGLEAATKGPVQKPTVAKRVPKDEVSPTAEEEAKAYKPAHAEVPNTQSKVHKAVNDEKEAPQVKSADKGKPSKGHTDVAQGQLAKETKHFESVSAEPQSVTSPVVTPLRALIVGCLLFAMIVRRYYSLVDTMFAVIVLPSVVTPHILRAMLAEGYIILPLLLMSLAVPLQHATYTSWVVKQMANANWLYFANLIHHAGLCLYCGQFILTSLRPSQVTPSDEADKK